MKRLVLVDGNALLHRAYHATPPLTTSKGELVNAVYGFTSMIFKAVNELKPDFMCIAWDEKGPTFRHQVYTQYKATRGPADDGLSVQYEKVHRLVDALNMPEFSIKGYEADDLIATLVKQAALEKNLEIIILTGDRDIMQIIDKNIKVLMPKKTLSDVGLYGKEEFISKYGFEPKYLVDYKALAGDPSDNIPGVSGIGDVSATKLVQQFKTVEKIYQAKNLKGLPVRIQTLLSEGAEAAVMSKNLVTLDSDAPLKLDLSKCRIKDYDIDKAASLLREFEFKSLIVRLPGRSQALFGSTEEGNNTHNLDGENYNNTTDLDLEVKPVLEEMSRCGVLIDLKFLGKIGKDLKGRLTDIEDKIYSKVGHQFNLNSPKQLSVVLFDELKLPVIKKTKTGRSTDEGTLHELSAAHPVVPLLLQYRQLFKLISTYVDALPKCVKEDGRIHSTFNVEGAATGRLSSQDPNLQNIPIRGQLGAELRKAFIASKGKVLLGADYSQIELRIMAHLADDPGLKRAFQEGADIHTATAAKIFGVEVEQVTKEQRAVGKTMNFATLYGQGPHALSQQLGVDHATARLYIDEYFEQFPRVREWMTKTLQKALVDGFVETLWGRKRYIPELQASNHMIKAAGERAAINHPVQGTAADMIKKAMVEIDSSLRGAQATKQSCCMILQVHDELLFECDPKSVKETAKMVKDKMENALRLSVPVVVDLKVGKSWGEMEKLQI